MSKVTAIIPVRNMSKLLPRAIESLNAQTMLLHKIIVVDDGSTDDAADVAVVCGASTIISNEYADEPWGVCASRNKALEHVTTEFVLPLDADDWIEPTYVEKTMAKMTEGTGIVSTHFMYHGSLEGTAMCNPEQTYESELSVNNITVCSLVRTEALRAAGPWDDSLPGWEDWDMWLRILSLGWKHAVVPEVLFHYRLHDGGMNFLANTAENQRKLYERMSLKHPKFHVTQSAKGWIKT